MPSPLKASSNNTQPEMESFTEGRELINVITKLHEAQNSLKMDLFDLPQIVVVGQQSAGKSSVLQNIVGFDFLPRGLNMVTKRPIVVQMKKSSDGIIKAVVRDPRYSGGSSPHEIHEKGEKLAQGLSEAIAEANKRVGRSSSVCSDKIFVEIHHPKYVDLTVVDLPGIVNNTVPGGGVKGNDTPQIIEDMVTNEIKNENTIILLIHPANQDTATDTALRVAREVDPQGSRTIGVLSKVDANGNAEKNFVVDTFFGPSPPKAVTWVPVKGLSADDVASGKKIEDQRETEKSFFQDDPVFNVMKDKCGIPFLVSTLEVEFVKCIRRSNVIGKLSKFKKETKGMLKELQRVLDTSNFAQNAEERIAAFFKKLESSINGSALEGEQKLIGAKAVDIFQGEFVSNMLAIDPLEQTKSDPNYLQRVIRNSRGIQNSIFPTFRALRTVVKDAIESRVLNICDAALDEVYSAIVSAAQEIKLETALDEWIIEKITENLDQWFEECRKFIHDLILMEVYINNNHPNFPKENEWLKQLKGDSSTSREFDANKEFPMMLCGTNESIIGYFRIQNGKSSFIFRLNNKNDDQVANLQTSEYDIDQIKILDFENRKVRNADWVNIFSIQRKSFFCKTKDEVSINAIIQQGFRRAGKRKLSEEEMYESYLNAVFDITRIKIIDTVPKAINHKIFHRITNRDLEDKVRIHDLREIQKVPEEFHNLMGFTEDKQKELELAELKFKKIGEILDDLKNLKH